MKIKATASFLPDNVVTNQDLSQFVDTNHEWIVSRTGIESRHFAKSQTNTQMAISVGQQLMERSGLPPESIGCIMVASFTPDDLTPSMSCQVHQALNLPATTMAFDFNTACSGFVYGLSLAQSMLIANPNQYIMLIGSERISPHLNFEDRNTCILFGDGAGGAILSAQGDNQPFCFGTKGDRQVIHCPVGGKIHMEGKEVFVFAVNAITQSMDNILQQTGLQVEDIHHVVCHQANLSIISHVYKKLHIPKEKFYINLNHCGNTSSASIPLVLDEMNQKGLLLSGQKILAVGFGAGLTWGATLIEW